MFADIARRVPDYSGFRTLADCRARTQAFQARRPDLVTVRRIGQSRRGEPIELISISGGPRSAMVVAGVHSNETVGGLTVDFLMDQLTSDDALRARLGYSWHFINPIDPDGLLLNESWLDGPLDPRPYLHGFFRPALTRQPEYTFPIEVEGYRFNDSPPENVAWRHALDLVRPDFLYTLHNAEFGGAFFITSRAAPEMEQQLIGVPGLFDVGLSHVGEPPGDWAPVRATGVFALPTARAMLAGARAKGVKDLSGAWPAGGTSTEYAERFGAFCFAAEVPLWDDPRVFDHGPGEDSIASAFTEVVDRSHAGAGVLERWGARVAAEPSAQTELGFALRELLAQQPERMGKIEQLLKAGAFPTAPISVSDALHDRIEMRLFLLRPHALIARIARDAPAAAGLAGAASEAQAHIDAELAAIRETTALNPKPLRSIVGVQAIAGLMAVTLC